ncbi:Ig-like domain-containing protein [Bacteroides sp. 224]|uniref:Ig-like domain-containing protein n=1 Tax=Bacteroides sp. 224 TaxID=2302936 RepID=UPI0013D89B29|nr:Ig-like domain-containing protein [Bacteroides sp. 224]NDV67097.1 hypothetical protein [Bacteroides sp. 224]
MLIRKNNKVKRLIRNGLALAVSLGVVYSCASIGRPTGGPEDFTPPKFVRSTPSLGATKNKKTKIVLEFDEIIKLEKASEKLVISPPQLKQPEIKTNGRRLSVNLLDTLIDDITYTLDFADAIVDNNEGNPMGEFSFSFSTGEVIDTMEVSGVVLDASNLEPIKGILVGLHSNLEDSAFTKLPFERVSRTDSRGRFVIRGITPDTYRMFALMDADQNYSFSQKSEMIAYYDSLVIPHFERRMRQDTTWIDSLTIDTIIEREYTHYLPDAMMLRAFKEEPTLQYLVKNERLDPRKFSFYFSNKADTLPTLKGLNFDEKDAFVIEKNLRNDTIHYWIKDSLIYKNDTLIMSLDYLYTDTLNQLVPRTDTLKLAMRKLRGKEAAANREKEKEKEKKRKKKDDDEEDAPPPTEFLKLNTKIPSPMDVFGEITLEFDEPLDNFDTEAIHLKQKVDTLWYDVKFEIEKDPLDIKKMYVYTEWEPEKEYEFSLDSMAFIGLYGLHTDKVKQTLKVRTMDDYGQLGYSIQGAGPNAFVELLDVQDNVVRRVPVENGLASFYFLLPGKYAARLINDRNGNGVWDTGDFEKDIQPEEVYYYPEIFELRVLMDIVLKWDVTARSLDKQKPDEMKKQKPDERKKRPNSNQNQRNSNRSR